MVDLLFELITLLTPSQTSLPFDTDIDVGFGIAVKTYLDDYIKPDVPKDEKTRMKNAYSSTFLPHAINFVEDLDVAFSFFDALHKGVKTLSDEEMKSEEKKTWDDAKAYLELRR